MENRFRVVCCKDFPNNNPIYVFVESIEAGLQLLKKMHDKEQYHSDQFPLIGSRNIASVEVLNPKDNIWDSLTV